MTQLLLGIDIGTGSSKALLATPGGDIVATRTREHAMSLPRPGWAEMDAEGVWWNEVAGLCQELVTHAAGQPIAGVAVSGLGPSLLPCDAQDRPLRPAILYGIDMRATRQIAELTNRLGEDRIVARGGSALSTQAIGPKLLWIRQQEPDVWRQMARWYSASSFVVARLTGEWVLDHHTASQCDPLYDMQATDWAHDWVADIFPGMELPRLAWSSEVVGEITPTAAAATGLVAGTPVTAGTVDAWAEAFSAGARRPGDLMLMYGSTMFFIQFLATYRTHPKLWTTAGLEPNVTTLAAGMATSGSLTTWFRHLCGDASFDDLVGEAEATPAGANGLVVLPYFAGERTPIFDPRARGVIAGLTLQHSRGHIFRAVYEGIGFGIRQILELLDSSGESVQRLIAVGGGTQGGLWTQVVTDITGREQTLPTQTIGASYGDALLAATATGLVNPDTDWATISTTVVPDRSTRNTYDELFEIYSGLYPAARDLVHRLAVMQESGTGYE
ncbi:MAG: FGGY-family carbohydrate kinase [Frankiaceae bacterium]